MSDIKDILGFEAFNLKNIGKKIKDNPLRVLYGGIDPASTKVWNKVLNRDDEPLVDQWGGASADTYRKAEDAGIDTKAGHNMHRLARVIATYYAGSYGASAAGIGGAGSAGGSEAATAGGSGSSGWMSQLPSFPSMGQAQQPEQEPPVKPLEVEFDAEGNPVIVSSKSKKTPRVHASMSALVKRGLRGDTVIDELGVRTGLIKEAGTELDQIEAQLDKLLSGGKS